ncbi:MAG: hypothetical protein IT247_06135 [Bacteroidia bacterium]|nr:hypothetical protein [Bacteroidia bacterium]
MRGKTVLFLLYLIVFYYVFQFFVYLWHHQLVDFFVKNYDAIYSIQESEERGVALIISGWIFSVISYILFLQTGGHRYRWLIPLAIVMIILICSRAYMHFIGKSGNDFMYSIKYIYLGLLLFFYSMYGIFRLGLLLLKVKNQGA